MLTLIKTAQDGRKLEVAGLAILFDGKLEAFELLDVTDHPRRLEILHVEPAATHIAGRVALTRDEAERARAALAAAEADVIASPAAIAERFRLATIRRACREGIE
ncbi:hypothetical protein [Sphingomonas hengshuiensis]|uniref:Uncharacterized protein n=1 Tax=Sphingomonas hengshuiensis TaxID=1609977 RepID=A0A7U5BFX9_9SPHN|nr:hypothetical protein [Sphingomonas hengshuiensis]AJP74535.1 hypothetical protein TS85_14305 [Sphingomonas hengshuiensis]